MNVANSEDGVQCLSEILETMRNGDAFAKGRMRNGVKMLRKEGMFRLRAIGGGAPE